MLKLNENEYNLDHIFGINFDLLKEILIQLAKDKEKTIQDIIDIKNINIFRDQRISDLEQKITELNENIKNINDMVIITEEKINNEINEINIGKNKNFNSIKKIDNFVISNEELNLLGENHAKTERSPKENQIINIKEIEFTLKKEETTENKQEIKQEEKQDKKIRNILLSQEPKPAIKKKYRTDKNLINISELLLLSPKKEKEKEKEKEIDIEKEEPLESSKSMRNILHEINNIKDKINYVERNLLLKNSQTLKISKDLLSEHNVQTMPKFNSINDQLNRLNFKIEQMDKAFILIAQKFEDKSSANLNPNSSLKQQIIKIFDNNEDENNDNNVIPKSFVDSVNKRFQLNHDHYKKLEENNNIIEQNITNILDMLNKVYEQIDSYKKRENNFNEEIIKINDKLKDLIEFKNNELNKNDNKDKGLSEEEMNNINNYIDNYIDKKFNELVDNLLADDKDDDKKNINENINPILNSNIKDRALIKLMNKKVNQFNEKLELMDSDLKLQKKNSNIKYKEIDDISQKLSNISDKLLEKIEEKDLKDLNNKTQNNTDEIDKINSKIEEINAYLERIRTELMNLSQSIELVSIDVSLLKDNPEKGDFTVVKKEYNTKVEEKGNSGNYTIDDEKLKSMVSPLAEEIQKIIMEIEDINLKIKELSEQNKLTIRKNYVEKIESNINNKINLMENNFDLKYLKKTEFQKTMKTFEIQIKQLEGNTNNNNIIQKQENENWILAKHPLKCFNCASCEANINSTSLQQNEPIAWNRYHGKYRIGQGFSRLLKKLNKKSFEEKELNKSEKKTKFFDFSFENIGGNNIIMMNNNIEKLKINHRFIEDRLSFPISMKKYKLPKVIENFRKKQKSLDTIPLTDEEKEVHSNEDDSSPKIVKITRIKNDENPNPNIFDLNNSIKNKTGRNQDNKNKNLNRIQSLPLY